MKVLTAPSNIASKLDWRRGSGSVLALDIHRDRIGISVSAHPSNREETCTLDPLQLLRRGKLDETGLEELASIVNAYKVCGVIVSWPLQQDTGKMGAACGRVLHTLEALLDDANNVITPNRPLCLWDGVHPKTEQEDEWGRCSSYSRTSDKQVHVASQEQYYQDENVVAAQVWEDFCRVHWPDLYREERVQQIEEQAQAQPAASNLWQDENWDDNSAFMNVAVV